MRDPQEFISDYLSHEYDPAKAREYYLRTRKLKGRQKGSAVAVGSREAAKAQPSGSVAKPVAAKVSQGKRIDALKGRLNRLTEILDLMESKVAAAQARSGVAGVEKKAAAAKTAESSKTTPAKAKTGAEKKEAAKAAKERYEKNATAETSKGAQAVQDEIEEVQKKIALARDELTAALAKARASSPKPKAATKRRPTTELKKQGGPSK